MERKNKRARLNHSEATDEAVPRSSRSSSPRPDNNSIDRFTEVITNLLNATSTRTTNVAFKGDVVPSFDPADKEQTAETWCKKVDDLRTVFNWSEDATIYFALSKLSGLAETWYKGLPSVNFSWEEWKNKMKVAFPSQRDFYQSLQQLMQRRKLRTESYSQYYYEMLALLNHCKISGSDAVSCLIGGIDDVVIKMGAKAGYHQSPESLFGYLSSISDIREPVHSYSFKTNNNAKFKTGSRFTYARRDKTPGQTTANEVTCYRCGKQGHFAKSCAQKSRIVCTFCGKDGHNEKQCFKKNKQNLTSTKIA